MKSIMLERDGDAPLVFEGELLAEARGGDPDRSRWHELALYRSRAGNYVLEARYESRWQGESGAREALVLDGPASLRASLRAYDPLKNVVGYPPGAAYAGKQARLETGLRRDYESLVRDLYRSLPEPSLFAEVVE